jgi:hypothetical protein
MRTPRKKAEARLCSYTCRYQILKVKRFSRVVNKRRKILNLALLEVLTKDRNLDEGLVKNKSSNELNKESALRDAEALSEAITESHELGKVEANKIVADLIRLDGDPTLLQALQQRDFVENLSGCRQNFTQIHAVEKPLAELFRAIGGFTEEVSVT